MPFILEPSGEKPWDMGSGTCLGLFLNVQLLQYTCLIYINTTQGWILKAPLTAETICKWLSSPDYADMITMTISRDFCSFPEEITLPNVAGEGCYLKLNASWWRWRQNAAEHRPPPDGPGFAAAQMSVISHVSGNNTTFANTRCFWSSA